jgi:hypothetical protein
MQQKYQRSGSSGVGGCSGSGSNSSGESAAEVFHRVAGGINYRNIVNGDKKKWQMYREDERGKLQALVIGRVPESYQGFKVRES